MGEVASPAPYVKDGDGISESSAAGHQCIHTSIFGHFMQTNDFVHILC